jgi:hypothetical protein
MWTYEGAVDASGKSLVLSTRGPCPAEPGKVMDFREVTEFKDNDHKVFTSSMQDTDGKWVPMITVTSKRKK